MDTDTKQLLLDILEQLKIIASNTSKNPTLDNVSTYLNYVQQKDI